MTPCQGGRQPPSLERLGGIYPAASGRVVLLSRPARTKQQREEGRGGQPGVGRTEPGGMVGPIGLSLYVSHHLIPGEIWELVLPCIIQYIISTIELASN